MRSNKIQQCLCNIIPNQQKLFKWQYAAWKWEQFIENK